MALFDSLCLEKLQTHPYFTYDVIVTEHEKTEDSIQIIKYEDTLIYRTYIQTKMMTIFVDEKFNFYTERQPESFFFPDEMQLFYEHKAEKEDAIQSQLWLFFFRPSFQNERSTPIVM